jgi:hypothetical protein
MGEQIEREAKWLEGRDQVGDELRWTMWSERDRADEGRGRADDIEGEMSER